MKPYEYASQDAVGLARLIASREISANEAAGLAAAGIAAVNPALNAVIEVFQDRIHAPPSQGPLAGVPMLNKDLSFADAGRRQEMGSVFARGRVATGDSTSVARLRAAGLNLIGRTTTPEFGNAGITRSVIAGVTRNPWDLQRTPGGSSGGSAAMVAAGAVPVATASDGGGSTRTPASYCGLVGLKPTRALVPVGPARGEAGGDLAAAFAVTRSMRDCAALLDVMSGPAPGDPYLAGPLATGFSDLVTRPPGRLRIAWSDRNWAGVATGEASRLAVRDAVSRLQAEGHPVEEAAPDFDWEAFFQATIVVMCSHIAHGVSSLAAAAERQPEPHELQSSTWACVRFGQQCSADDLLGALDTFNDVSRRFGAFFERHDVLVLPTNLVPAPLLADCYDCDPREPIDAATFQASVYSNDHFLAPFNTTGGPAITLPLHQTADGLPLGVQFVSRQGEDATLLQLGAFFEQVCPWRHRRPPVHVAGTDAAAPAACDPAEQRPQD